tara:strand:+ start:614 stop:877 length:264 start_codon:yes stop_codon:yes gene_type:complete
MKLTEAQIWKCNNDGEGGVHICLDHQNVVDFARAIEREIGFAKAELWLKRINDAVLAEREACAKLCLDTEPFYGVMFANAIRARGTT